MKLVKYNIFKRNLFIHNNVVNNYLSKLDKSSKLLYMDTILIMNKLGIDMVTNNNQLKKHKTTKISIITD
uniref:Uncharacterized protein n=1 Tax=viral metagenome TaxID=1070528 RepID=A0A6C0H8P1_9ZZZZ